nr:bicyclomycin/multidrug efflux system [Salmonella sp. NCTC 7297]
MALRETLPVEKRQKLSVLTATKNTVDVVRNPTFLFYAAIPCFAYAAYFAYIVESPFMLAKLGLSPAYVGYTYILLSASYVAGNLTAKRRSRREGIEDTIRQGYRIFVLGGIIFALQMYVSPFPLPTTIIAISILTFGNGFLLPLGDGISHCRPSAGLWDGIWCDGSTATRECCHRHFFNWQTVRPCTRNDALIIACVCVFGFLIYVLGQSSFMQFVSNKESKIND